MLKNTFATVMAGLIIVNFAGFSAEAREKHADKRHTTTTESHSITYRQSAPESGHSKNFGLGFSTLNGLTGGMGSITGTYDFTDKDSFQGLINLSTAGTFQFYFTGLYKRTLVGTQETGFHIGGGVGLGVVAPAGAGVFAFNISGLAGFHFSIPGLSQVRFHLDGGPTFAYYNTFVSTSQFQVSSLSSALGASVVYIF